MAVKLWGIEIGLNAHETKVISAIGLFLKNTYEKIYAFVNYRCPHCKSRKIVFKEYVGDEPLELYNCFSCNGKSIMTAGGLVDVEIK